MPIGSIDDASCGPDTMVAGRFGDESGSNNYLFFYDRDAGAAARYEEKKRVALERVGAYADLGKA